MPRFADFESHPNVLFIMVDQQRHDFLGYRGADFVSTPNLDKLAERSMVFTHCFSTGPVCAPARIGLASGFRPHRFAALTNAAFLPAQQPTYYQQLRNHGYRVGCVGKLDLAKPDRINSITGDRPCTYAWGFTDPYECEGKVHAGQHADPIGPYTNYLAQKGFLTQFHEDYKRRFTRNAHDGWYRDSVLPAEDFEDLYIGRYAANWLRNAPTDYPWHYFVSFVGPHDPFDPPTEYADRYRNAAMPDRIEDSLEGKPDWHKKRAHNHTPDQILNMRRQYCGSITAIDDAVGEIIDALEASGQMDRTYIVFSSDHGEMLSDHGMSTKDIPYESAWRVPLLVTGPDIEPGESDALIELIDIHPTICQLADVPVLHGLDARSFVPLLTGDTIEHRDHVATFISRYQAIRTKEWKFVNNINDIPELYNVNDDPCELRNIADENPDKRWELSRMLNGAMIEGGVTRR